MEPKTEYLYGTSHQHDVQMRICLAVIGVIAIGLGIASIYYQHYNLYYYYGIFIGIVLIIYAIGYNRLAKRCYIAVDDNKITSIQFKSDKTNLSPFISPKKIVLEWDNIQSISIGEILIKVVLLDNQDVEISLGQLSFNQVKEFKKALEEYAIVKNKMVTG
ncbi:MAG TPA: hypothetical protein PLP19_15005 [bacterium]|nr:hypothetical protein [bacterium]HPN44799.1 hypothetical protein [bacterium]